jgi:hypothetical protein
LKRSTRKSVGTSSLTSLGRPTKEEAAERARVLLESIKPDEEFDIRAILEAMIRNPATPKTDRFKAMELHMKLPREPLPRSRNNTNNNSGGPLVIYSLPRGSSINPTTGEITIPEDAELVPVVPYQGTPSLPPTASDDSRREHERLEVMEASDDGKVATLTSYGRTFATGRRLSRGRLPDDDDSAA